MSISTRSPTIVTDKRVESGLVLSMKKWSRASSSIRIVLNTADAILGVSCLASQITTCENGYRVAVSLLSEPLDRPLLRRPNHHRSTHRATDQETRAIH